MRVVVQVCKDASCEVDNEIISKIEKGFMLLVGININDTIDDVKKVAHKVQGLRVFPDSNYKMNLSLKDVNGDILSISQFTLYADSKNGFRPSFINAMKGNKAKELYDLFNELLRESGLKVYEGKFGSDMHITFTNMGPTTIILDSKEL